jgi:hypothetical protein
MDRQFVYNGESISYYGSLRVKRMGPQINFRIDDDTEAKYREGRLSRPIRKHYFRIAVIRAQFLRR